MGSEIELVRRMRAGQLQAAAVTTTGLASIDRGVAALQTIPFQQVSTGPILENVITGDDVDVTRFPAPKWHERDGGRYIGTGSFNVTRDPGSLDSQLAHLDQVQAAAYAKS